MKFLITTLLLTSSFAASAAKLDLVMTNLAGSPSAVYYAIIDDPKQFPDGKTVKSGSVKVDGKQDSIIISVDLPPGSYAVSTFLDENLNTRLDKRFGIPTERFEFSNNPKLKFGPPSFGDCEIRVQDGVRNSAPIRMKYFKSHLGV
jgi:uncharacterized protein (DUF2141 family)